MKSFFFRKLSFRPARHAKHDKLPPPKAVHESRKLTAPKQAAPASSASTTFASVKTPILPGELWADIFNATDARGAYSFRKVCRAFYELTQSPTLLGHQAILQQALNKRHFGGAVLSLLKKEKVQPLLPHVRTLYLYNKHFTPQQFAELCAFLAENCPNLTELSIARNELERDALAPIRLLQNLRSLNISGNPAYDEGIAHVAELPKLHTLHAHRCCLEDGGFLSISTMATLRVLTVGMNWATAAGGAHLAALSDLEVLDAARNDFDAITTKAWGILKKLREVDLSHNKLDAQALEHVGEFPSLEILSVGANALHSEDLFGLQRAQKTLRVLRLHDNQITSLVLLEGLELEALHVGGNPLDANATTVASTLTTLRVLDLYNTKTNPQSLVPLTKLRNLRELYLERNPLPGDALRSLLPMKHLRRLAIGRDPMPSVREKKVLKEELPELDLWD